jgi:TetR/AcrR family transcriptional regulator
MYSKFEGLDEEKKQRILNAAMKEFAGKGYDHASTNKIVEDAGIAKGLLFHYFKSKKQLFLYLYDYCLNLVMREISQKIDYGEKDFFKRLLQAQSANLELISVYPDIMDFLKVAYLDESAAVRKELDERKAGLMLGGFQKAFEGIDTSAFRPDLDIGLVIKTVAWAYEGFANSYMETLRNVDTVRMDLGPLISDSEKYSEFLKKCFYK